MKARRPFRQNHKTGSTKRNAAPEFTDLAQAEMETITGGVARDTPDALHVGDGALEEWDDGWWFLKFR